MGDVRGREDDDRRYRDRDRDLRRLTETDHDFHRRDRERDESRDREFDRGYMPRRPNPNHGDPIDPDRKIHNMIEKGDEWADKRRARKELERAAKVKFASLCIGYRQADQKLAMNMAEKQAEIDQDYNNLVTAFLDAEAEETKAKLRFSGAEAELEAMRSAEATKRAELRNLGSAT